jgi:hypothetical protein
MSHRKFNMLYLFPLLFSPKRFGLKVYRWREYFFAVEKLSVL